MQSGIFLMFGCIICNLEYNVALLVLRISYWIGSDSLRIQLGIHTLGANMIEF